MFLYHSMGGLLTRYYLEVLGGSEITRRLLTMGTPYRGAAQSLVDLVNGVRKGDRAAGPGPDGAGPRPARRASAAARLRLRRVGVGADPSPGARARRSRPGPAG